ncbi:MAG: hypothetical protein AB1540_09875 [Bdellovibrionota bacterium]
MSLVREKFEEVTGVFKGDGIHNERQAIQARLIGEAILGGQAFQIHLIAHDASGDIVHEEQTIVSAASEGKQLQMFNFNTSNRVAVLEHVTAPEGEYADGQTLWQFASKDLTDANRVRMRVTLRRLNSNTLEYNYEQGLPGMVLQPLTSVVLSRV